MNPFRTKVENWKNNVGCDHPHVYPRTFLLSVWNIYEYSIIHNSRFWVNIGSWKIFLCTFVWLSPSLSEKTATILMREKETNLRGKNAQNWILGEIENQPFLIVSSIMWSRFYIWCVIGEEEGLERERKAVWTLRERKLPKKVMIVMRYDAFTPFQLQIWFLFQWLEMPKFNVILVWWIAYFGDFVEKH